MEDKQPLKAHRCPSVCPPPVEDTSDWDGPSDSQADEQDRLQIDNLVALYVILWIKPNQQVHEKIWSSEVLHESTRVGGVGLAASN